jgi:integrase
MKLTKASVDRLKLPRGKSELIVFDEALPGFGLRMRSGGKRTWIAQYRLGAKQRRVTLGTVETIDADDARRRAKDALARVQLGQDPQAEKTAARAPKVREMALTDAVERYLTYAKRKLKASTYSGIVLHLRKHWQPLHAHELQNLERRHVAAELGRIANSSGLYGANRSRAALSALFAWAIGEGLTEVNPVVGTNKATDEIARDRVLSSDELSMVWQQAGQSNYGAIIRLLILTGQRREEVGGMRWSEIDLNAALWHIGAERIKNGLAHDVPLSSASASILRGLTRREKRDLVFGTGDGPFQGWSNAKSALDARMLRLLQDKDKSAQLSPWRIHDIRRTVATRLADLGVLPHVVEAVLNHISGYRAGVAGVYNRATYATEKRAALDLWARRLAAIVENDSIPEFQG